MLYVQTRLLILRRAKLARFFNVSGDLLAKSLHVFKFFLGAKELDEFDFDIGAIDVAMEIEKMHFDHALGFVARHRGPESDIHYPVMEDAFEPGFNKINPVWRKLFTVCAEIRRRKTKLPA